MSVAFAQLNHRQLQSAQSCGIPKTNKRGNLDKWIFLQNRKLEQVKDDKEK